MPKHVGNRPWLRRHRTAWQPAPAGPRVVGRRRGTSLVGGAPQQEVGPPPLPQGGATNLGIVHCAHSYGHCPSAQVLNRCCASTTLVVQCQRSTSESTIVMPQRSAAEVPVRSSNSTSPQQSHYSRSPSSTCAYVRCPKIPVSRQGKTHHSKSNVTLPTSRCCAAPPIDLFPHGADLSVLTVRDDVARCCGTGHAAARKIGVDRRWVPRLV